jgi:hypothetical protein
MIRTWMHNSVVQYDYDWSLHNLYVQIFDTCIMLCFAQS